MFGTSDRLPALRDAVQRLVETEAIPREDPVLAHDLAVLEAFTRSLRVKARAAGIYAPQLPPECGGLGLS